MASGEDSLIARYFRPLATDPGAFGLGDDAAVLDARGDEIVVTTDAVVEGVRFSRVIRPRPSRARRCGSISAISRRRARCRPGLC